LDGDQVLDFYWIDPKEAAKRFTSKPKFAGKLCTKHDWQDFVLRPGKSLAGPIQAWFFNLHNTLTDTALLAAPVLCRQIILWQAQIAVSLHHPIYSKFLFHAKFV
jgi:hypothetical protein